MSDSVMVMTVRRVIWSVVHEIRRGSRCYGTWGWMSITLCVCLLITGLGLRAQREQLKQLSNRQALWADVVTKPLSDSAGVGQVIDGREQLQVFDALLLEHDDIPSLVMGVFQLAEEEGLRVQRGDYQAEVDEVGHFLRYRMNIPIQGSTLAIHRFMRNALLSYKSLALERVQFKREDIGAGQIEARIHWVVLARLPGVVNDVVRSPGLEGKS